MSRIKRRYFLQFAGSSLAAIGLSQIDFFAQADRYGRVLAQGTPRKLALLVGINHYIDGSDLSGCLTDVQMQYELLVSRFGFNPADILMVADDQNLQPTRENIVQAFRSHLIAQAKPGDVVVFHYSGHGSLIKDASPLDTEACRAAGNCDLNGTIVPNNPMPAQTRSSEQVVPDIMGKTLFLMMRSIQTENLTVVLDSCHSGAATRGNAIVRAITSRRNLSGEQLVASEAELTLQQELLGQLSPTAFQQARQAGIAKGIAIGSASRDQSALDVPFDGFHAGAFTYLLTRYLWQLPANQTMNTIQANITRSTRSEPRLRGYDQIPVFEAKPNSENEQKPFYFTNFETPSADAVITKVFGDRVEYWAGGVASEHLQSSELIYTLLERTGQPVLDAAGQPINIQQQRLIPNSLYAEGKLLSGQLQQVQPGMLLRERIVGIPTNLTLSVGIDDSLSDQFEPLRTALQNAVVSQSSSRIQVSAVDRRSPLEYIFGRMTEAYYQQLSAEGNTNLPPVGSIGLFEAPFNPIHSSNSPSSSFGRIDENPIAAINRLKPKFKSLLIGKLLRSLAGTSSDLRVVGEISAVSSGQIAGQFATQGVGNSPHMNTTPLQSVRSGDTIQFQVENLEQQDLYLSCLAIGTEGDVAILYPATWNAPDLAAQIDAGSSLNVPRPEDYPLAFRLNGSGAVELLTLVSQRPLRNTLLALQTIASDRGINRGAIALEDNDPLTLINSLLDDVNSLARGGGVSVENLSRGQRSHDTNTLAVFSTVIEITES